jgi:glycosyltransferase involved in cell wall biosynthesis
MPTVSVVVPNYNHARFLRRRVESILEQTFQDFELILLDDCSTDESQSILSSYASNPRVKIEFNLANSGSTFKQWNKGARLASGKYLWIAESDDYADKRLLERLTEVLDADPKIAFAYCRSWRVSSDDQLEGFADLYLAYLDAHKWTENFCTDGREMCRNYLHHTNPVPNASAVLLRKHIYELVGGADESLRLCGDWKLWIAMALAGKVAYLREPLSYFRFHEGSVRSKTEPARADVLEHLQVIRWFLDRMKLPEASLEEICEAKAALWVPALMSLHVPLALKWAILQHAWALDPHPIRSAVRPGGATIRRKFSRHWRELRSMVTPARS